MAYLYEIIDHDIGSTVHSAVYGDMGYLLQQIYDDVDYDFESDAEVEDDPEAFMAKVARFSPNRVVKSLRDFDFCNGTCKWICSLPGGHREFIVTFCK